MTALPPVAALAAVAAAAPVSPRRAPVVAAVLVLATASIALVVARAQVFFPIGMESTGSRVGNLALAVQLAAIVAGVAAVNLVRARWVLPVLALEGTVCLLAHGLAGLIYLAGLALWYGVLSMPWLGRARPLLAAALLVAMNACAWSTASVSAAAALFSVIFTMRLLMFTWDRWQNDFERALPLEYAVYMLVPPLTVIPPYMTIIPFFSDFAGRIRPELTWDRLRQAGRHIGWAALFGGLRAGMEVARLQPARPLALYWHLVETVLDAATFAHLLMPLLSLHGIEERLPLSRPLLSTRFLQFWTRYQVHQKDAQVFLFFTPALLRLRRLNRHLGIWVAIAWTMMFGNTFIHVVTRYCFLPSLWGRLGPVLLANLLMTVALATEMSYDHWQSTRSAPAREPRWRVPRLALGWAITQTLAATVASL